MIANLLISTNINSIMSDDSGETAMVIMGLYHVRHLPIVENGQLIGIISEDDIYSHDTNLAISNYISANSIISVSPNDHLFEVMATLSDNKLTLVPVIDKEGQYLGVISQDDLIHFYANSFSFSEPGSIILLEVPKVDYSLEEISRLVESENAAILSSFLSEVPISPNLLLVTIKLNKMDIGDIISSFERHDYIVKKYFSESEFIDELKDNYNNLMNYLDL